MELTSLDEHYISTMKNDAQIERYLEVRFDEDGKPKSSEKWASAIAGGITIHTPDEQLRRNETEMGTLSRMYGKNDKFVPKSKADIRNRIEQLKRDGKILDEKRDDDKMMEDTSKRDVSDIFTMDKVKKNIAKAKAEGKA